MEFASLPRRKRSARCRFYRPRLEWLEKRLPPAAGFANATPLNDTGQVLTGSLGAGQVHDYSLSVTQGTYLIATAVPEGSTGFEPRLTLYDATGQMLIESDQHAPGLAGATVQQHLQPGSYYMQVSAAASSFAVAGKEAYQLTTALTSTLPPFSPFSLLPGPGPFVADLRGNGSEDLIIGNAVFLGNGDGTFQPPKSIAAPGGVAAVADLNGDGRPDIVASNGSMVSVLLGDGDGTFQPARSFAVPNGTGPVAVADLRGDGVEDIVTAKHGTSTVSVLLGNGNGTFEPAESFRVGKDPHSVAVANLGNGHPDIITGNSINYSHQAATVSVLLGNGDGTFQPAQSSAVGPGPITITIADPGNGHSDIVTGTMTVHCRCCWATATALSSR
jgi:hypothetical protein